jgi:DNA repair protein RecN (Recombination protein N)
VLAREVRREGRNICRVNGRTVTLNLLHEIGAWLVDVHGQSEHLSLLRVSEHIHILDRYAKVDDLLREYARVYQEYHEVHQEYLDIRQREQDASRRSEFLVYQINEIEAAQLVPHEEQALLDDRIRLANAEQLALLADESLDPLAGLDEERPGAIDHLGHSAASLARLIKVDPSLGDLHDQMQALADQTSDIARQLRAYRDEIEFNPSRLNEVEERLSLINGLKRKYGEDIPAILSHAESAREELETLSLAEERLEALEAGELQLLGEISRAGQDLSRARRKAIKDLSRSVAAELDDLKMEGAQFDVDIQWDENPQGVLVDGKRLVFHPTGLDRIEFLVAPNPGEGLKPLVKIASGGETSRLMLGLKGVLAQADRTPTLIFDEIDQGIGGRVGATVGKKLWNLSRDHQVLCVTHLPQLAAFGDQHFNVLKEVSGGRTMTEARELGQEKRIPEMASMLGGITEPNLESAAALLLAAQQAKEK